MSLLDRILASDASKATLPRELPVHGFPAVAHEMRTP